jgi:predicted nucleic acid-binding protein
MQLLISDANILIDIDDGGLLSSLFRLPYEFVTPDVLFDEELKENHPNLLALGLRIKAIESNFIAYAFSLKSSHGIVSVHDCLALSLAKQEACPLLTGDRRLKKLAEKEAVIVKGTIWIVEQMVTHQVITLDEAKDAYQKMKGAGSRLPFDDAIKRLDALN